MVRFIKDIIGSQILLFQERAQVGPARDVIIDSRDGSFLGIIIYDPIAKENKVIPASEIKGSGKNFLLIKDYGSISELSDVVKIKEALEINPKIIGAKVETESGQFLGKVDNATVSFKLMALEKLYVAPASLIKFLVKDLIIPAKKIIEIQKNKIIVSDEFVTIKEREPIVAAIPVPE